MVQLLGIRQIREENVASNKGLYTGITFSQI